MKTTVEPLEGNKVRLSIEVDEAELEPAIEAAFHRIAREVRLPGFRPGKAPRKVLEARIGAEVAREEALRDALPNFYAEAVHSNEVDVIASPEIEITAGQASGPLAFDAVVEVRPRIEISGYHELVIEVPAPEPTDEEIDEYIERVRDQHGELAAVERAAAEGDYVTIDISASRDGEPLDMWSSTGYVYQVGAGAAVREIDENLVGASAGETVTFTGDDHVHEEDDHPDHGPIEFVIDVTEVKEKVLPELDDAWVAEITEFETVAELRADLRDRLRRVRIAQAQEMLRERTADALASLVGIEPPEPMLASEMQHRMQDLSMRLGAQGMKIEQYLAFSGQSPEQLMEGLHDSARRAVLVDLGLRALAEAESLEVAEAELEAELEALAERVGETIERVRADLESSGHLPEVRSDLRKRRALDWLVERVEVVGPDGASIDREALTEPLTTADEADEAEEVEDREEGDQ